MKVTGAVMLWLATIVVATEYVSLVGNGTWWESTMVGVLLAVAFNCGRAHEASERRCP